MIGRTIGNYVVSKVLGEGGMGAVYLAEHPRIHRRVAIKVLHPQHGKNTEIVSRFFTEARAANSIGNEHIIDILDFGELEDGTSYCIMEWLDGRSLADVIAADKPLSVTRAIHIMDGVGSALQAAHEHGIVHRDLKPDNIFLVTRGDDAEFAKVLDFGVAKLLQADPASVSQTRENTLMGTPSYMSPEQCQGARNVDQRSDIYALGVILYEMVTGQLPFIAEGLGELLVLIMTAEVPSPRSLNPSIPEMLEDIILHALAKAPEERFQTVSEMVLELDAMLQQRGPSTSMPIYELGPSFDADGGDLEQMGEESSEFSENHRPSSALQDGGGWWQWLLVGIALIALAGGGLFFAMRYKTLAIKGGPDAAAIDAAVVSAMVDATSLMDGGSMYADAAPARIVALQIDAGGQNLQVEIQLSLRALPAGAEIYLDDKLLANPFEGNFPRDNVQHRLTVKAKGYSTENDSIMFNHDRTMTIKLERSGGGGRTALPPPPPITDDPAP